MSDNKLLSENTIRRFMKLANVDSLSDNFLDTLQEKAMRKHEDELEEGEMHGKNDDDQEMREGLRGKDEDELEEGMYEKDEDELEEGMHGKDEDELEEAMHGKDEDELEEAMHGKDEDDEVVDLSDMEGGEDDKGMGAMAGMDTAPEGELADVALTREEAEVFADFGMRVKKALDSEGEADAPDEDMAGVTDMDDEDEMGAEEKDAIVQEVLRRVTQRIVEAKLKGK